VSPGTAAQVFRLLRGRNGYDWDSQCRVWANLCGFRCSEQEVQPLPSSLHFALEASAWVLRDCS
jgi:hypothetical protein